MAISLSKMEKDAPKLVPLYKEAGVSLQKAGLSGEKAAVYLVLDHSGSMQRYYRNGHVQHLAEQTLALSAQLDDDGIVPVVFFNNNSYQPIDVEISKHDGAINRIRNEYEIDWGGTNYAPAMRRVVAHYQASGATDPAFVVYQTDGRCYDEPTTTSYLQQFSELPLFWQFVGYGEERSDEFAYLRRLDKLKGRKVDNAGFFAAGDDPMSMSNETLYGKLMKEYPSWLKDAKKAGIL